MLIPFLDQPQAATKLLLRYLAVKYTYFMKIHLNPIFGPHRRRPYQ
jgi:hypothetical protein